MLFQDIRDYQILFLSLFLFIGIGTRDWTIKPELIVVTIVTSILTQWVLLIIQSKVSQEETHRRGEGETRRHLCGVKPLGLITPDTGLGTHPAPRPRVPAPPRHPVDNQSKPDKPISFGIRSPLITSLGLCLLLRADHWTTMVLAAVCAIASKFVFKVGDKHFFNPANFGIITVLLLTPDAWVSPGQWGEEWLYGMLFVATGGMVLQRVGRWDTTTAFLGSYAVLEAMRNIWLRWTWDVYWHRLMSGSLLLFALFMVTDPRSIPNARIGRLVWAICIAIVTYILRNEFYLSTAVFWALFALAPLTVIFDTFWQANRFVWQETGEGMRG